MKFSILQETLKHGLSIVGKAVSTRSTLPVLSNIFLEAEPGDPGRLRLEATNLEVGIRSYVPARVDEAGAVTLPGKLLADLVNSLPPERVDLTLNDETQTMKLACARFNNNVKGLPADEFPVIRHRPEAGVVELDPIKLKEIIGLVTFAAATDEARPILTGVLVEFRDDGVTMVAADGFRLAVKRQNGLSSLQPGKVIIPAKALADLGRLIDDSQPVEMYRLGGNQILFCQGQIEFVTQIIEGNFPDYTQIVPKSHTQRAVMDRAALQRAVKLVNLFGRDASNIIKFSFDPAGTLTLSATSAESGDGVAEVPVAMVGDSLEIAFNGTYILEALAALSQVQVALETTSESQPGVIRPVGDDGYTHVIMPMHITR